MKPKKPEKPLDTRKIESYLSAGYSVRKKPIAGKTYGYAQKGSHFVSLGRWEAVESYLKKRAAATPDKPPTQKVSPKPHNSITDRFREHQQELRDLKNEGALHPSKISNYLVKLLPVTNPDLWNRLRLFSTGNVRDSIREAVSLVEPFDRILEKAAIAHKELPDFDAYLVNAVKSWIEFCIKQKRPGSFRPRTTSALCMTCGSLPVAIRDPSSGFERYSAYCQKCEKELTWNCVYCETKMRLPRVGMSLELQCANCDSRAVFDRQLSYDVPETEDGKALEESIGGKLDSHRRLAIVNRYERVLGTQGQRPEQLYRSLRNAGLSAKTANDVVMDYLMEVAPDLAMTIESAIGNFNTSMGMFVPFGGIQLDQFWASYYP